MKGTKFKPGDLIRVKESCIMTLEIFGDATINGIYEVIDYDKIYGTVSVISNYREELEIDFEDYERYSLTELHFNKTLKDILK